MNVFRRRRVHLAAPQEWGREPGVFDLFEVLDAPGPLALSARVDSTHPCGLWLTESPDYPLSILARDLVTASRVVQLSDLAYEGEPDDRECLEELVNGRSAPQRHALAGLVLSGGAPRPVRVWTPLDDSVRHRNDSVPLLVS